MALEAEAPPTVVQTDAPTLTRSRLAEALHRRLGVSKRECAELVDDVLQLIADGVVTEGKVKLAGFGTFTARDKAPRMGRNPATDEALLIGARRVLTFRPSKSLRAAMNRSLPSGGS